jgi:hypothetical protein
MGLKLRRQTKMTSGTRDKYIKKRHVRVTVPHTLQLRLCLQNAHGSCQNSLLLVVDVTRLLTMGIARCGCFMHSVVGRGS